MGVLTRAERNIAWAERHIRIPEGKFVGQPLVMAEFMKDDFRAIYDNPVGTRRAIIRISVRATRSRAADAVGWCGTGGAVMTCEDWMVTTGSPRAGGDGGRRAAGAATAGSRGAGSGPRPAGS